MTRMSVLGIEACGLLVIAPQVTQLVAALWGIVTRTLTHHEAVKETAVVE